jgi:hypothetical protein
MIRHPLLADLGGAGELYNTRPRHAWGRSRTEWHWACFTCESCGHNYDKAAEALQGLYWHRAAHHGLPPASDGASDGLSGLEDLRELEGA